jgi:hypothetical protein
LKSRLSTHTGWGMFYAAKRKVASISSHGT